VRPGHRVDGTKWSGVEWTGAIPSDTQETHMGRVATRLAAVVIATLGLFAAVACGDDVGSDGDSTDGPTIIIKDVTFMAPDVTVAVGGAVTFDNQDNQAHTATGTGTGSFATDTIGPGTSKTVMFDDAGTFAYICSFHPFMKGSVTVE
jgi:plastocyanin